MGIGGVEWWCWGSARGDGVLCPSAVWESGALETGARREGVWRGQGRGRGGRVDWLPAARKGTAWRGLRCSGCEKGGEGTARGAGSE
jgi:hypothetical protein